MINTTSESLKARKVFFFQNFWLYEQLKFHAQLSWASKKIYNLGPDFHFQDVVVHYRQAEPDVCSLDVLFLHGMKFSSQTWFDKPMQSLQILSKLGYNAVAIDLPGNSTLFNQRVLKKNRTDSIEVILFGLALFAKIISESLLIKNHHIALKSVLGKYMYIYTRWRYASCEYKLVVLLFLCYCALQCQIFSINFPWTMTYFRKWKLIFITDLSIPRK